MKSKNSWYLIAYDIREAKRLRRLHGYLRKNSIQLQNSVFMAKLSQKKLKRLGKEIVKNISTTQDDIRIYPINHPDTLWAAGNQVNALSGLYSGINKYKTIKKKAIKKPGLITKLMRIFQ